MYTNNYFDLFALGFGIIVLYFGIIIGITVAFVIYYKTIIESMALVRPSNRETGVGNILFNLIPILNIVYGFIVYPKICDSFKNEYHHLGLQEDGDFGKGLAITLQALLLCSAIPLLNFLTLIASLIIWIVLWVKFDKYKKELEKHNGNGFNNSDPSLKKAPSGVDVLD